MWSAFTMSGCCFSIIQTAYLQPGQEIYEGKKVSSWFNIKPRCGRVHWGWTKEKLFNLFITSQTFFLCLTCLFVCLFFKWDFWLPKVSCNQKLIFIWYCHIHKNQNTISQAVVYTVEENATIYLMVSLLCVFLSASLFASELILLEFNIVLNFLQNWK